MDEGRKAKRRGNREGKCEGGRLLSELILPSFFSSWSLNEEEESVVQVGDGDVTPVHNDGRQMSTSEGQSWLLCFMRIR